MATFLSLTTGRRVVFVAASIATMVLFGFLAGINRTAAFIFLLATGVVIFTGSSRHGDPAHLFGIGTDGRNRLVWMLTGALTGFILSAYCRYHIGYSLIPAHLTLTALAAPVTGMTEELVYRGFIQGMLSHRNRAVGVITASAGHTVYKVILLATAPVTGLFSIGSLAILTFVAGYLFGYFRVRSGVIYPAVIAHGIFDLIVYGDQPVPSWMWL